MLFITVIPFVIILKVIAHMTVKDMFMCILAFIPTGWVLLVRKRALVQHPTHFQFRPALPAASNYCLTTLTYACSNERAGMWRRSSSRRFVGFQLWVDPGPARFYEIIGTGLMKN